MMISTRYLLPQKKKTRYLLLSNMRSLGVIAVEDFPVFQIRDVVTWGKFGVL